jgi:hypothetical protein
VVHREPARRALRARLGLPSAYVLFVGTLEPRKDLRTLLAAHQLVPDAPPLVLVGPPGWGEQVDVSAAITPGFVGRRRPAARRGGRRRAGAPLARRGLRADGAGGAGGRDAGRRERPAGAARGRRDGGDVRAGRRRGGLRGALSAVLASPGDPALRRAQAAGFTWQRSAALHRAAYALATSRP